MDFFWFMPVLLIVLDQRSNSFEERFRALDVLARDGDIRGVLDTIVGDQSILFGGDEPSVKLLRHQTGLGEVFAESGYHRSVLVAKDVLLDKDRLSGIEHHVVCLGNGGAVNSRFDQYPGRAEFLPGLAKQYGLFRVRIATPSRRMLR